MMKHQLISQAQLWQAKQKVQNSNSYSLQQQQEDDFMRKMRHTLVNGIIASFKELTEQNQQNNFDYASYFITKYKSGPLHMVCENGRHSLIKHFVGENLFPINQKIDGYTPFILLTLYYIKTPERCNTTEMVELMIEKGADPLAICGQNGKTVYDFVNEYQKHTQQELNFVLQYIQQIYIVKKRQQALKNAILLMLCHQNHVPNKITNELSIINFQSVFNYIIEIPEKDENNQNNENNENNEKIVQIEQIEQIQQE